MKRFGNLYEKIISLDNLEKADRKAQRGKSKQFGVIRHNKNQKENILKLQEILKNQTYKTSEYFLFTIYENKVRQIPRLPYFPDRIVHHALMLQLEEIFVKSFISQTYSCIKKRGIHKALGTLRNYLRNEKETTYCLKIDIKKFYPSINLEILKILLKTKFKDAKLLNLLFEIIDSNKEGLPLGNYLSQWLANFYLNKFDHWLKENRKIKYYLRYCDDIVILHSDKEYLHNLRKEIQNYLRLNLKLELSNYQVFPVNSRGIDFLGYVSFHKYTRLRKSIKKRFIRMIRKNKNKKSIASYNGWLVHGNCVNLTNKYLK